MLYGKKPFGEELSQDMILTQQTILKVRHTHTHTHTSTLCVSLSLSLLLI